MQVIKSQGHLLQAFLYKLIGSTTFGEFINSCDEVINLLATTDAIDLISLDHPELDIKKPEYGYDSEVREKVNWRLAERLLKSPKFPLLTSLKAVEHVLSVDEVLKSKVNEDLMFRDLDNAGLVSSLGPPVAVP